VDVLASDVDIRPSVASHHLGVLEQCGLVAGTKVGRYVIYVSVEPELDKVIDGLMNLKGRGAANDKAK